MGTPITKLNFPAFLMNFPFTVNTTIHNNAIMDEYDPEEEKYNYDLAFSQWMNLYQKIVKLGGLVYILPSEGSFQDQPFVANIGVYLSSVKEGDVIVISNFASEPRRGEELVGAKFFSSLGYTIVKSPYHLEGEAELKWLRDDVYFGGYGLRTDLRSHYWLMNQFNLTVIPINLNDSWLYHLDCVLFPINKNKTFVVTSALQSKDIKLIEKFTEIIDIQKEHAYESFTNCLIIGNKILHAPHTPGKPIEDFNKLAEKHGFEPINIDLEEFGKSGADLSCMIMKLNNVR